MIRCKVALIGKCNSQTEHGVLIGGAGQHPLRALAAARNSKLTTNNSDFAGTRYCRMGGGEVRMMEGCRMIALGVEEWEEGVIRVLARNASQPQPSSSN